MNNRSLIASTAISGLLALGLAASANAAPDGVKEKCYGVAKAGQNLSLIHISEPTRPY